jgi:hypothetical protein
VVLMGLSVEMVGFFFTLEVWVFGLRGLALEGMVWVLLFWDCLTSDGASGKELYDYECDEMERTRLMVTCFLVGTLEILGDHWAYIWSCFFGVLGHH